ncbi:flagellar basal-body MS-ring/collar protein FliF [Caminicella sporogenes]|uniref:flagellar basal-body MS-ring/collar protein FliF n=1 Tax=Caminicella sporogenes TaxID=166485 RepID=UPI00253FEEED|nr:flagellar basal-body MS-ring/collar protein FliF [Caminicella sporogenes]WIF94632.1 flagellar basal-body MS-ring/collar protein FliF [Caminicella sporogenes]
MGESLEKIRNQLNEFFQSLNKRQKILIGLGSLFLVSFLSLAIFYFAKPDYKVIYSGLNLEEAGQITAKLDEMNIPWKDANGGTTILVPKESVNKARMNLAVEGFPNKEFTWSDAFNSNSLTMTSEERRMKYLKAQMSELAQTIETLEGVVDAKVNLSVPDNSDFLTEKYKFSKASVVVTLKRGYKLTEQQVNGIVMIVANAVEGLKPENVSVHDSTGRILNSKPEDSEVYTVNNSMDIQQQVRTNLQNSIKNLLAKIYGFKNVDVMVNVKLNFDKEVTQYVEFNPPLEGETNGLIRSISKLKEQVADTAEGGPPGTDSNSQEITEYKEFESKGSKYEKENTNINYELNEIRKNIVKAPGQIEDISVAVIINRKSLPNGELTEEHKQQLIKLVSAAAGLETKVVEVMASDFNDSDNQNSIVSSEDNGNILSKLPMWSIGIISLLLIIGVVFTVIRIRKRKNEVQEILEPPVTGESDEIEEIDLDFNDKASYKYQIEKFLDKKPEAVAQLLRNWLNED